MIEASPADDESEKNLKQIKQKCVEENKHRDTNTSAAIIYKIMRNGKRVDSLVIFKEGTTVPPYWLSGGFSVMFGLLLVSGLAVVGRSRL